MDIKRLWIDESGDCGFKFDKGSSRFLIIVAVYAIGNIENVISKVEALKTRRSLHASFEFKFSRCRDALKRECLRMIAELPIAYKAIVVDKKNVKAPALALHPRELYFEAVRRLLYDNNPPLAHAILIIDEAVAKIHHREWGGLLRQYVSRKIIQKVRQIRSQGDCMIQIADMIAGSIARLYEKRDDQCYKLIRIKEKVLIEF